MTLVLVYVLPLTSPHRGHLVEVGLLPTVAASLLELGAIFELLDPQQQLVFLLGDFNAHTAALAPTMEG